MHNYKMTFEMRDVQFGVVEMKIKCFFFSALFQKWKISFRSIEKISTWIDSRSCSSIFLSKCFGSSIEKDLNSNEPRLFIQHAIGLNYDHCALNLLEYTHLRTFPTCVGRIDAISSVSSVTNTLLWWMG